MYSELSGLRPSQFGWIGDEFQGFTKLSTSSDRNSGDICFDAMWLFVFIGKYPATLIQPQTGEGAAEYGDSHPLY